ncbi:hypothetical protein [Campylobacter phage CJLB-10]|nr:hypothetical protein [Campylobacter phage CJLB-10]
MRGLIVKTTVNVIENDYRPKSFLVAQTSKMGYS